MNRKTEGARSSGLSRIFDRLTLLVLQQELFASGQLGPVTPQQMAAMMEMSRLSRDVAALVREELDR